MKYDSLLYGNGLTLKILYQVKNNLPKELQNYVTMDDYLSYFVGLKWNHKEVRNFRKTFEGFKFFNCKKGYYDENNKPIDKLTSNKIWFKALDFLSDNIEKINKEGAENWLGSVLFKTDYIDQIKPYKEFLYSIYNYWYMLFKDKISENSIYINVCDETASNVLKHNFKYIFTTNFDTILDGQLKPQHLHGKFVNYSNYDDLRIFTYTQYGKNKNEFPYLFGTNGSEKSCRLTKIRKNLSETEKYYDNDFFFNDDLNLGHILIYGLSFRKTPFMEEFNQTNTKYNDEIFVNYVDGHILMRLLNRKKAGKLKRITLAYYSDIDKVHYEEMFSNRSLSGLSEILTFVSTSKINI